MNPATRKHKPPYTVAGRAFTYRSEYAAIVAARATRAVVTDANGVTVWAPKDCAPAAAGGEPRNSAAAVIKSEPHEGRDCNRVVDSAPAVCVPGRPSKPMAEGREIREIGIEVLQPDTVRTAADPVHGKQDKLTHLQREIARTDTVMLHSLRAGFLRVGTDECLASAEVIAAEIARRTDASCEGWARNLRLPIDGRRLSVSAEERRDAEFRRRTLAVRSAS